MFDSSIFNEVLEGWRKDSVKLLPPHNEAEVIEAFEKMNRKCSADVIAFYCATGGMERGEIDSKCFNFWSLERVIKTNNSFRFPHIAFADFLIESHHYYLEYEDENITSVFVDSSEKETEKIVDDVHKFFEIYVHDFEKLELFG